MMKQVVKLPAPATIPETLPEQTIRPIEFVAAVPSIGDLLTGRIDFGDVKAPAVDSVEWPGFVDGLADRVTVTIDGAGLNASSWELVHISTNYPEDMPAMALLLNAAVGGGFVWLVVEPRGQIRRAILEHTRARTLTGLETLKNTSGILGPRLVRALRAKLDHINAELAELARTEEGTDGQ